MKAFGGRAIALAGVLLMGGCSSQDNSWSLYFQVLREGFRGGYSSSTIARGQAASVPYASLGYRIDGGGEMMLVLATDTNGDQLWTAASHVVLLTRGGRIARSVGLQHDRGGMTAQVGGDLPAPSAALKAPYRSMRLLDFPDIGLYGVAVTCITADAGRQPIVILGTSLGTRRVVETCSSKLPRWSFADTYWVEPDSGFVWRSLQHLHPQGPVIEVEILRPPG
jgi:hypothetical protein